MVLFKNKITAQEIESANIQPLFEMRKFFSCFFSGRTGRAERAGTGESASRTGKDVRQVRQVGQVGRVG